MCVPEFVCKNVNEIRMWVNYRPRQTGVAKGTQCKMTQYNEEGCFYVCLLFIFSWGSYLQNREVLPAYKDPLARHLRVHATNLSKTLEATSCWCDDRKIRSILLVWTSVVASLFKSNTGVEGNNCGQYFCPRHFLCCWILNLKRSVWL